MFVVTTLNINKSLLESLKDISEGLNISVTRLIVLLLKRVMSENKDFRRYGYRVRYQERDSLKDWHTFHLRIRTEEYEYFLDMRKFFKMSVSLLLSFAYENYLDDIIGMLTDKRIGKRYIDNYLPRNYILINKEVDSVIKWIIYWGYTEEVGKDL